MKKKILQVAVIGMIGLGFCEVVQAGSTGEILKRCTEFSLDAANATEATEWAYKCGLISKSTYNYMLEPDPRPMYPIWVGPAEPHPLLKSPELNRNAPCSPAPEGSIRVHCLSGCFPPEMQLLTEKGYQPIGLAEAEKIDFIQALDLDSTLAEPKFSPIEVDYYTSDYKVGKNKLIEYKMASGKKIEMTLNHPMMTQEGSIKDADQFKVGDFLVKTNGDLDKIIEIKSKVRIGKVHNVQPKSKNFLNNVIAVEGYLVGSSYFQNEKVAFRNRSLYRDQIKLK